jgi:hypothetical protein
MGLWTNETLPYRRPWGMRMGKDGGVIGFIPEPAGCADIQPQPAGRGSKTRVSGFVAFCELWHEGCGAGVEQVARERPQHVQTSLALTSPQESGQRLGLRSAMTCSATV